MTQHAIRPGTTPEPDLHLETAYAVTDCAACDAQTALVVREGVYCCMGCGATGDTGWVNLEHSEPDEDARAIAARLNQQSKTIREFTRYARQARNRAHR